MDFYRKSCSHALIVPVTPAVVLKDAALIAGTVMNRD